jgi:hypothetical protein
LRFLLVNYKKHNDSKNVFAFSRTPTTFISSMVICYLIAGILDTIWLGGVNFIFMFAFWVCFVLLSVWLYTKYSGEYAEIGEYIDFFADVIWNNVRRILRKKIFDWIFFLRVFNQFILDVYVQQCDLYLEIRNSIKSQTFFVNNPTFFLSLYSDISWFYFLFLFF